MVNIPDDRSYSKEHEWAQIRGDHLVRIGLTEYAAKQLGDVVFVDLPKPGDRLQAGEPLGTVESVKSVSEIYAPVSGVVAEVNEELNDSPESINDDPYGDGWMIQIRTDGPASTDGLLDAHGYADYIKAESDSE